MMLALEAGVPIGISCIFYYLFSASCFPFPSSLEMLSGWPARLATGAVTAAAQPAGFWEAPAQRRRAQGNTTPFPKPIYLPGLDNARSFFPPREIWQENRAEERLQKPLGGFCGLSPASPPHPPHPRRRDRLPGRPRALPAPLAFLKWKKLPTADTAFP